MSQGAKPLVVIADEMKSRDISLVCSDEKVVVLPNTINTEAVDVHPVDETLMWTHKSEFTLGYTGTIDMHRGLGFLLDTMSSLLEHCSAQFVIVGEARILVNWKRRQNHWGQLIA